MIAASGGLSSFSSILSLMEGDINTGGDATVNSINAKSIHSRHTDGLSLNKNTYIKPTILLTEKL